MNRPAEVANLQKYQVWYITHHHWAHNHTHNIINSVDGSVSGQLILKTEVTAIQRIWRRYFPRQEILPITITYFTITR